MADIRREATARPIGQIGAVQQISLTLFSFPYNFIWGGIGSIVLPLQIASIVGERQKELATGVLPVVAAVLTALVGPVAGAVSDRTRGQIGRRPHIALGFLGAAALMPLMAGFGAGSSIVLYALLIAALGITTTWARGAQSALFADTVPEPQRGSASGWSGVFASLGLIAGLLLAGQIAQPGAYGAIYTVTTAVILLGMLPTLLGVREVGVRPDRPVRSLGRPRFIPAYATHRDFYWTLLTRAFNTMGVFAFYTFVPFFMADIVKTPDPARQASYFLAATLIAGMPTALLGGYLADRFGRKRVISVSGGLMALGAALLVPLCFVPSLPLVMACAALIGAGSGAYQAVDWALVLDVLPELQDAGKDLNLWMAARIIPQSIAPPISGLVLSVLKPAALNTGYGLVWGMAAIWFILAVVFIGRVRGSR